MSLNGPAILHEFDAGRVGGFATFNASWLARRTRTGYGIALRAILN
jgi:hypothetical protein